MKSRMNIQKVIDQPTNNNHGSLVPQERCQLSAQPAGYSPLSLEEFHRLLASAGDGPVGRDLQDIATIVYFTGARPGELKSLAWCDVDMEKRSMRLKSKNGGRRTVPFNKDVLEILVNRAKSNADSEYVLGRFPETTLGHLSQRLRSLPCGAGGQRVTLRSLRHSFAENWIKAGGCLVTLQAIMGFSSLPAMKVVASLYWGCDLATSSDSKRHRQGPT